LLQFLIKICRFNFGTFEEPEFKKFLRMGFIFAIIIGVYWTLRILKDALFIDLVGKMYLPYAKTISVLALLPLVIIYTKLLEKTSRERMLVILPTFYALTILLFCFLMIVARGSHGIGTQIIGYTWYLFVESFGSLAVALFWAFAADTTESVSAKRGFPLVYAIGQIGGIICPYGIAGLPHRLGLTTDTLTMIILFALTISIVPLVRNFLRVTPKSLLVSFHGKNEKKEEAKHQHGFLEGLQLLVRHKYLIAIFFVNFTYELIITIFDFNFKIAAGTKYSGVALSHYLSIYGSSVNIVTLACFIFGISNITRYLGVTAALAAMPIIIGGALLCFMNIDSLTFLFILMVGSKAINYALNGPALKMLYVPTTTDVRFKAQAWIETFGARASKQAGSMFNMILNPLQNSFGAVVGRGYYLTLSGFLGFPFVILWFITAIYLGSTYNKAIKQQKSVC
jgi:AAA family ATP:ADP antiporter